MRKQNPQIHALKNEKGCGDAGDWTPDLSHAKRTLYHWATTPTDGYFCLQKEKINTYVSFWKLLSSPKMHFIKLSSVIKLTCSNISIELCPCSLIIRFHLAWKISVFCVVIYEVHATSWRHLHTWRWRSCWRCPGKVWGCRSGRRAWGGVGCVPTCAPHSQVVRHLCKRGTCNSRMTS